MIRKTREIIIINEKERYRVRMSSWLFKPRRTYHAPKVESKTTK